MTAPRWVSAPGRVPPPHGRHRLTRASFALAALVNVVVLYWPRQVSDAELFPNVDKVVHVGVFVAVAWTGVHARVPRRWLVPVLVVHAVSSEVVQHWLLPARSGDPRDAVADLLGIGLGLLASVATARGGGLWRHARVRGGGDRADWSVAGGDPGAR